MFVRYRYPYTYTVLQSIRTPAGPRQRCIAHWSGTPSLAEAIKWAKASYEASLALCRQHHTLEANRDSLERERAQIAKLEAVQAVLGDWVDPVERQGDAERSAKSRWQLLREARDRRWREKECRENEEYERWLEGMMKIAM